MTPFWLPVHAPNLNPIEWVWHLLKWKLARHRFWADVAGLEQTATVLLARIEAHVHTEHEPSIYLRNHL